MAAKVRIALVTAEAARGLDDDLEPLQRALAAIGAPPSVVAWDQPDVDWAAFDLALLRSTWDYTQRLGEFLAWAERAAAATRLLNPLPVVRWNVDKHYLGELSRHGVATVPSSYIAAGDDTVLGLDGFCAGPGLSANEFVVKPCVGAGSRDAQRYAFEERSAALDHIRRLQASGRDVLLQPYLDRVDQEGETALIYFEGQFSHAIRKGPLLQRGVGPTRALFAAEHISARTPSAAELRLAEQTLAALPFDASLLYARVDLIRDASSNPCVLELELIEPSLFFAEGPGSVERFAAALLRAAR